MEVPSSTPSQMSDSNERGLANAPFITENHPAYYLFARKKLYIARKIEALNLMVGYDEPNEYTLNDESGQVLGYIVEKDGFSESIIRNAHGIHASMEAQVLNANREVILKFHRPHHFANSSIQVSTNEGQLIGRAKQKWHLVRRKYELFTKEESFARVSAKAFGWSFKIINPEKKLLGHINRKFTNWGTELYTNSNHYEVDFDSTLNPLEALTPEQRAIVLACAISIDFDFFTRTRNQQARYYQHTLPYQNHHGFSHFHPQPYGYGYHPHFNVACHPPLHPHHHCHRF